MGQNTRNTRIENQMQYLVRCKDRLVIDADVHATDIEAMRPEFKNRLASTPGYYHGRPVSAEDLIREMDTAGVDMALVWQNPSATAYGTDPQKNFDALLAANQYIHEISIRFPERFIPAGWTDPKALGIEGAVRLADICIEEYGFAVVKMNPAQNGFPIDGERVIPVFERIVRHGAIPAFHFGADTEFTPAAGLASLAERHPDHPLVAVHMGGGGASYGGAEALYRESRELGLDHPNIRFVLSTKRDAHIESDLIAYQSAGEPFCRNLCCGSDAPYGRMAWNFGGFRWMFKGFVDGKNHHDERVRKNPRLFDGESVRNYMGRNFAELVIEGYRRLLR